MLLLGISGKLAAQHLFANPGPGGGYEGTWHTVVVRSFWAQADLFAFGMAVAAIRVQVSAAPFDFLLGGDGERWRLRCRWDGGCTPARRRQRPARYSMENTVIALVAAIGLALVVLPGSKGRPVASALALEAPAAVALGLISYSSFSGTSPSCTGSAIMTSSPPAPWGSCSTRASSSPSQLHSRRDAPSHRGARIEAEGPVVADRSTRPRMNSASPFLEGRAGATDDVAALIAVGLQGRTRHLLDARLLSAA